MSARIPEPCDIPADHEGPVRFYRTGWKCERHAPTTPTAPNQAAETHRKEPST
ncbi:hypothetical protein [Streptomyces scabiei]|uniref:hypothetical protein n=1 Tax=Streptomyces scabiei TaxID=1930 RepID=UPI000A90B3AF|nr:hypothetical protein [Streptomyces scabiei]